MAKKKKDRFEIVHDPNLVETNVFFGESKNMIYHVTNLLKAGKFNVAYTGTNKVSKSPIILKPISSNGHMVLGELHDIISKDPLLVNVFLEIISVTSSEEFLTPFAVFKGGYTNLVETFNPKERILDHDHIFLKHSLRAVKYLHEQGFIHGNLRSTSFWCKIHEKFNSSGVVEYKFIHEVVLADLEHCIKVSAKNSHISDIYVRRFESKPECYKYCALGLHKGEKKCMKNDFESIYYIFVELCEKKLPWNNFSDKEELVRIEKEKMRMPTYDFFRATPEHLAEIICFIDMKSCDEPPDTHDIKQRFNYYLKKKTFFEEDRYTLGDSDYTRAAAAYRAQRSKSEALENSATYENLSTKVHKIEPNTNENPKATSFIKQLINF